MIAPAAEINGSRTFIATHLRKYEQRSHKMCVGLWKLDDPAFKDRRPFVKRLSLVEEGSRLPEGVEFNSGDNRLFSRSGAIDDPTPPPRFQSMPAAQMSFRPANQYGYAERGEQQFVLGGGNLNHCLWRTFASLVGIKLGQQEPLRVIIPLAMVYWSRSIGSPVEYVQRQNRYTHFLESENKTGKIGSFQVLTDGQPVISRLAGGPMVELHWFTSLRDMFSSSLFPETNSPTSIRRLIHHFSDRR